MIPSRMGSRRLPGKPLADIAGQPMIVRVWQSAITANIGPVVVACAEEEIAEAIIDQGGTAVLTDPDLPSGSDRLQVVIRMYDPQNQHDVVINLQGDLPLVAPSHLKDVLRPLETENVDIATLVCPIENDQERHDPNIVKAAVVFKDDAPSGRVSSFSRADIPNSEGQLYHHIGIYAYRRAALKTYSRLPPGRLEQQENLEQLRALENGMRIDAIGVEGPNPGVDTPEDLERVRGIFSQT